MTPSRSRPTLFCKQKRRSCASASGAWRANRGHFSSADPEVVSLHCNVCFEALQLTPAHFFGMNARFVSLWRPDADNRRLSACWERMWKFHCNEPSENDPVPRWQIRRGSEQRTYTCCRITLIQLAGNVINQWRLSFICTPQCSSNQIIVLQGCRIKLLSCGKQLTKKKRSYICIFICSGFLSKLYHTLETISNLSQTPPWQVFADESSASSHRKSVIQPPPSFQKCNTLKALQCWNERGGGQTEICNSSATALPWQRLSLEWLHMCLSRDTRSEFFVRRQILAFGV